VAAPAPRKILVVSHFGGVGELCKRFISEGNQVKYCIKDKPSQDIHDGLIQKVKHWEPYIPWADLIWFDDTNFGKRCDELRAEGKAVIGPTAYSDKLEMDRGFGTEEMKKAGMTTIPDWSFTSLDEAIAFVKATPGRYVVKPDGVAQDEKALTYVGKAEDGADVIAILGNYKKKWAGKIHSLQIQQFVKGV
jgi:phosphoribosylamine--glycine ligase